MTATPAKRMGGARPGAGRTQTTYKISVEAARRLREIVKRYGGDPSQLIEGLINQHYSMIKPNVVEPLSDAATQLVALLTLEAQTVETLCKRLRMSKAELERLVTMYQDELVKKGVHLHVATHSEVTRAIKLPGGLNRDEPTYYNKLSRNLFSLQ
ncbi:MAG: hypothetical protein H0X37_19215 [Herpetosiphonaceae bacterium]|nr:hypothetical protein [Herpetosiphonaceae bacterium]